MPTALGGNDVDRINQLMARFSSMNGGSASGQPLAAMNMFAGYNNPKGDSDLTDLLIDPRKSYHRMEGSPQGLMGDVNWNRNSVSGGGLTGSAMPHPMMMMPGQQNLMTNYFTPGLMTKAPLNNYMNTDYSSLPPAINHLLLEEDDNDLDAVDGGGGRGQSLSEKLR